jgi:hypothetical protein
VGAGARPGLRIPDSFLDLHQGEGCLRQGLPRQIASNLNRTPGATPAPSRRAGTGPGGRRPTPRPLAIGFPAQDGAHGRCTPSSATAKTETKTTRKAIARGDGNQGRAQASKPVLRDPKCIDYCRCWLDACSGFFTVAPSVSSSHLRVQPAAPMNGTSKGTTVRLVARISIRRIGRSGSVACRTQSGSGASYLQRSDSRWGGKR